MTHQKRQKDEQWYYFRKILTLARCYWSKTIVHHCCFDASFCSHNILTQQFTTASSCFWCRWCKPSYRKSSLTD